MKTILILEDDFDLAAHWRQLLESIGIRVIHECTAEEAIAVLSEEEVDLLITDMAIQDAENNVSLYGGLMVISYIAMNMDPPPKIIAVSGVNTDASFLSTFGLLNPDTALRKPVADSIILEKVHSLLAEREQDQRGAEESQLIERRMRRSLFATDRSSEAIYWVDRQGIFVYANAAAGRMLGKQVNELLGNYLYDIDPEVTADHWETHWQEISQAGLQTSELKRMAPDDTERWFLVHHHFYEFEVDQFIVANATDITKMKADAERIEEDSALLRATNTELQRSNTELERFAYVASHDLKSPLRGIASVAHFLREDLGEDLDEGVAGLFSTLNDSVERMYQIIDDLLLYSRVLRDDSESTIVDLNKCIGFATNNLPAQIDESTASIHIGKLPKITGFMPLLRQLFQNLIGNAIKYHGTESPEISIEGVDGPDGVEIYVRDNGIGIAPQFRQQVFELFNRLHHQSEYSGTGIGLAICQRVMERHNGSIQIDSNPNDQGCCFVLRFPLAEGS